MSSLDCARSGGPASQAVPLAGGLEDESSREGPQPGPAPPLGQRLALGVPGCLQVLLQPLASHLQLLHLPLGPLPRADEAHLLQQLLILVDEDQPVPLGVEYSRPGLAVELGELDLQVGDPAGQEGEH